MKILQITDNYSATGGAENYFFQLLTRLKQQSHLKVYCIAFGTEKQKADDVFILPALRSNIAKLIFRILPHPLIYFKIRRLVKTISPDIIHIHNIKQHSAALLKAIKGHKIVHNVHDYSLLCPTAQNIHRNGEVCKTGIKKACFWQHQVKFSKLVYLLVAFNFFRTRKTLKKLVNQYLAPSPLLIDYLQANDFTNTRFVHLFHTLKTDYSFEQMQAKHFLFVGGLGKHKGIELLLNEFAKAYKKDKALILHIAGMGVLNHKLHAYIKQLGLENNLQFHGWQNDLSSLFQRSCAIIFPSIGMESFGLVLTEAMGHARAIIAANRSSVPWLVKDHVNGLLFDPLKAGDLAEKICFLAENNECAKNLGLGGFTYLKNFVNNEAALSVVMDTYESVMRPCSRRDGIEH